MPQYQANNNFGTVSSISVETLGQPGQRTFRLLLQAGEASACLWLEKEQVQQLAIYIQEISEDLTRNRPAEDREASEAPWSGGNVSFEFKAGSLSLGHDSASNAFLFLAYDRESPDDAPADLSFWVTLEMARDLSKEALEVCASGRPRCFLCGQPINPEGHACVRSNGHQSFQP